MSFISGSNNLSDHLGTSSLIESVKHVLIYISFQTSKRAEREALTLFCVSVFQNLCSFLLHKRMEYFFFGSHVFAILIQMWWYPDVMVPWYCDVVWFTCCVYFHVLLLYWLSYFPHIVATYISLFFIFSYFHVF